MNARLRAALVFVLGWCVSTNVHAADLSRFITDLYGGDGIDLDSIVGGGIAHDAHFSNDSQAAFARLSEGVAAGTALSAFNSTVTSFTFDIARGVPVRTTESLGPILGERATTLGKGRFNVGFSVVRQDFDEFNGQDLGSLQLVFPHANCCTPGDLTTPDNMIGQLPTDPRAPRTDFENDAIVADVALDIEQTVFAFYGTYGITENWDAGVIVPIVEVEARARSVASIRRNTINPAQSQQFHQFGGTGDDPTDVTGGEETGLGDIVLRTKYQVFNAQEQFADAALIGQLTVPTGDEDNLLGTGETAFMGMVAASKQIGIVTPHANLGYEASTETDFSNVRYVVGLDAQVVERKVTVAAELLGRWFHDVASDREHILDVAVGAKVDMFGAPLNANVILPINDDGLRADVTWSVGIDYSF